MSSTLFQYQWHGTPLHRMDSRVRIGLFLGLQILVAIESWWFLGVATLMTTLLGILGKFGPGRILAPMKALWIFLVFILVLRAMPFTPADPVWQSAMVEGFILCAKVIAMLSLAQILTMSTSSQDYRSAVLSLAYPLPRPFAWGLALVLSLVLHFVPLLLDQARSRRLAIRNRGGTLSRRPLASRLRNLGAETAGLLVPAMALADEVSLALKARGLDRIPDGRPLLPPRGDDSLGLAGSLGLGLVLFLPCLVLAIIF